jgi:transcriptional regulator with XRE-family HTH domain
MTITGEQCKAARKLLKWSQLQVGYRAGVCDATIVTFEAARHPLRPENVQAIQRVLEAAGIEFLTENCEGPGVRLRKSK